MQPKRELAVIWFGPIYGTGGYSSVSRAYIMGLIKAGVKIKVLNYGDNEKDKLSTKVRKTLESHEGTVIRNYDKKILVLHQTPDNASGITFSGIDYTICLTIFETDKIPKNWVGICNSKRINEVWVPTKFNIETFSESGVKKEKLRILHYGLDASKYKPKSLSQNKVFRILYIADLTERKNIPLLIKAFNEEFCGKENIELFLHITSNNVLAIEEFVKINAEQIESSHITLSTQKLSEKKIHELIKSADLYISVDRANGWGMPCMEAMAMGGLAATVNWSGSTEFMDKTNSLLLNPNRLERASPESTLTSPLYIGHKWAHVEIGEIRRVLRYAHANYNKTKDIRKKALNDIKTRFSSDIVTKEMIRALNSVDVSNKAGCDMVLKPYSKNKIGLNAVRNNFRFNLNYLLEYHSARFFLRTINSIKTKAIKILSPK